VARIPLGSRIRCAEQNRRWSPRAWKARLGRCSSDAASHKKDAAVNVLRMCVGVCSADQSCHTAKSLPPFLAQCASKVWAMCTLPGCSIRGLCVPRRQLQVAVNRLRKPGRLRYATVTAFAASCEVNPLVERLKVPGELSSTTGLEGQSKPRCRDVVRR
jgi:hypothetical protein